MMSAVISPAPLVVDDKDLLLLSTVAQGRDQGKTIYLNTRWVKENSKELFDGENFKTTLDIMRNELMHCESVMETLSFWIDKTNILSLAMEEVPEFNEFYSLTKEKDLLDLLTEEEYDDGTTVAQVMLLNGMDVLIKLTRRTAGGN